MKQRAQDEINEMKKRQNINFGQKKVRSWCAAWRRQEKTEAIETLYAKSDRSRRPSQSLSEEITELLKVAELGATTLRQEPET
eukprot:8271041-Heterocapsa_arctica.AAC.1